MAPRASLPKMVIRAAVGQATKERTATKVRTWKCKSLNTITMKRTEMQLILDNWKGYVRKGHARCIFFDFNEEEELQ